MRKNIHVGCASLAVILALAPSHVAAQESRADSIAAQQAEKAAHLTPYEPNKAERFAADIKRRFLEAPAGFYPWFDSVYSGGGFTLGAGYRQFYGDRTFWDARGLYSVKSYKLFELATSSLGLSRGRVDVQAVGGWRDATQVNFYGVGTDTSVDAKSNFRLQQAFAGAHVRARGPAKTFADFGGNYEDYTLESGTGTTPSIEDAFDAAAVPGLGANPSFVHTLLSGGFDSRPSPGYARRGGLYALSYDSYIDPDDTYTFNIVQAEAIQHLPILRENWVVSLHGVVRSTVDDDSVVPYFLLPSLGSGSTLRAYPSWRFRDRHSLLMSGEWRWIPSRLFLDMAIFYDAGKVASERSDLDFDGLKQDFGAGIRFHGPAATPLRIDVAKGSEGINIVFSGAAAF